MLKIRSWLAHPLTRNINIDDPCVTGLRRRIIQENHFLRRVYEEWYREILRSVPVGDKPVLELGSGAGFLSDFIPGLITSEVLFVPNIKIVLDGQNLPFLDGALRAIVMTDVLHHIPEVRHFFREACRCVMPEGVVVMIEPWVTNWSSYVYSRLHHEPFLPDAADWEFPKTGPLSGANGALPWIVFERDRVQFEREFPCLNIVMVEPGMPFRYLVSGGVSLRALMPGWSYGLWRSLENSLASHMHQLGMFATIKLKRIKAGEPSPESLMRGRQK